MRGSWEGARSTQGGPEGVVCDSRVGMRVHGHLTCCSLGIWVLWGPSGGFREKQDPGPDLKELTEGVPRTVRG